MEITTSKKRKVSLSTLISIIFWILITLVYLLDQKPKDSIVFLNIGQGDATLLQQGNTQILIDGGPDRSILYELPKYMPFFDRKIEYIVLTHPHDDHLVGLLYVLDNYEVGKIFYYPVCYTNPNYEMLISKGAKMKVISQGDTIRIGNINMNVIWPIKSGYTNSLCYKSFDRNINNDSIVLEVNYLNKKLLLMGDAEKEAESVLVASSSIKSSDILKAGHHCSSTASSETFLKYVSPTYAICSCGYGNKFGHPSSETLKNFSNANVQYFVTYVSGNILFDSEDKSKL